MADTDAPSPGIWERIKQHRALQWGLAYSGGALALAQGYDVFSNTFGWPVLLGRVFMATLSAGLPVTLIVARCWNDRRRGLITAGAITVASIFVVFIAVTTPRPAEKSGTGPPLIITRQPEAARLYIDGKRLPTGATVSANRGQQLVAVAPGFYGEVREISASDTKIVVSLQPLTLPGANEYERFLNLADADITAKIEPRDIETVGDRTLRTALQSKLLRQQGDDAALEALIRDVETLARLGDSRAAVAMLLMESIRTGQVQRSSITEGLVAAGERGDAMASFFTAVALRDALSQTESEISASDPDFQAYCSRISRAVKQGWAEVARKYLTLDGCESVSP